MIDFPIYELLDDSMCTRWLERYLHPAGLICPYCGRSERRLFRAQGYFPAYRCRVCNGDYTLLTGTIFAKTRQPPATLVLLLRGIAKGEPTARLARELRLSGKQLHTLRQRIQANINDTAPIDVMSGTAFEADELYQNAGEKKARLTLIPMIRPVGVRISGEDMGPTPTIVRLLSVSSLGTRASNASGLATMPIGLPAWH